MVVRHGEFGLDEVSTGLTAWIGAIVPDMDCIVLGPGDAQPENGIGLRLVGIERSDLPAPGAVALRARYAICIGSRDVLAAHRAAGEIVFASALDGDVSLCGADEAGRALAGLALPPCQMLLVEMQVVRPRPVRKAGIVRHPLVLELEPVPSAAAQPRAERHA